MDTSGRRHRGLLSARRPRSLQGRTRRTGDAGLPRLHGVQDRAVGPGARCSSSNSLCSMGSTSSAWATTPSNTSTPSWSAPSSRLQTGKPTTVTRSSWTSRRRSCSIPLTRRTRRELIGEDASFELRPGAAGGRSPRLPDPSGRGNGRVCWCRRAYGAARRPGQRGHLPRRRGGPSREHGLGHPERRMAAELARDPWSRFPSRHPRADVLAHGRSAQLTRLAGSGPAPRSPPRWRYVRASRTWPSAPLAGTSRTSGP